MDKLTAHTLPDGREILFIEVPEGYKDPDVIDDTLILYSLYDNSKPFDRDYNKAKYFHCDLPQGKWRIIGVSDQMSEEECKPLVSTLWNGYLNYELKDKPVGNYKRYVTETAKDSFASLLRSLGLDTTKRYVLIEKLK